MASPHPSTSTEPNYGPLNTSPGNYEADDLSAPQAGRWPSREPLGNAYPYDGSQSRSQESISFKPDLHETFIPLHSGSSKSCKRTTSSQSGSFHDPDSKLSGAHERTSQKDRIKYLLTTLGDEFELAIDAEEPIGPNENPDQRPPSRSYKRPFIIRRKTTQQRAFEAGKLNGGQYADRNPDRFDYETRYTPDELGKEMEPGARFWRVYLDEAAEFDLDMVENMKDTVDVILVFAGLFSAIVTTLVALTATALQLDQPKVTNMLLMELIAIQRAAATGGSIDQITHSLLNADSPSYSTAEITDYWVNGLWFTSLAFSLSTALISVLVKQWVQAYSAPTFQGSPKAQAEIRHFRHYGIEKWHVPLIIGLLPTLLHLSLFLFFTGLVVFLFTLDYTIASVVTAIASIAYIAYVVTNLLPVWYAECPYKTPLSSYLHYALCLCKTAYCWLMHKGPDDMGRRVFQRFLLLLYLPFGVMVRLPWYIIAWAATLDFRNFGDIKTFILDPFVLLLVDDDSLGSTLRCPWRDVEPTAISSQAKKLHTRMFAWLLQTSSNPSARSIAISRLTSSSIGGPKVLRLVEPSITSESEWRKAAVNIISAQVTGGTTALSSQSFALYRFEDSKFYDHFDSIDRDDEVANGLLAAHEYCKIRGFQAISEEMYNVSSKAGVNGWASPVQGFLQRFCLHALHHATQEPFLNPKQSLFSTDLSHLYSVMRLDLHGSGICPTLDTLRRLKHWLPSPSYMDTLNTNTIEQMQTLLEVARHLLHFEADGGKFRDTFRNRRCLEFWKLSYERHHMLITEDLAEAFGRMMDAYVSSSGVYREHRPYLFDHLKTICLWDVARHATELVWHLQYLIEKDPWHQAWQGILQALPDLLPLNEKGHGVEFLLNLSAALKAQGNPSPAKQLLGFLGLAPSRWTGLRNPGRQP